MIQVCSKNMKFFKLKQSNTALIQTSMAYCTNIIGSLFYLLKEILDISISLFFLIPLFSIFFMDFRVVLIPPFLILSSHSRIFFEPPFLTLFVFQDFLGTSFCDILCVFQNCHGTFVFEILF